MVRQCAWCLRLINIVGERLSPHPIPNLYEATHGICTVCGALWLEQVMETEQLQTASVQLEEKVKTSSLSLQGL